MALARLYADLASGRALRIRVRSGLSQADMARSIGASPSAVTAWESRQRRPRGVLAERYAALLNTLAAMVDPEPERGEHLDTGARS